MAPTTVTKLGAVLPVDEVHFLDAHTFPGLPGSWMPGTPIAFDSLGVDASDPEALVAFEQAAEDAGALLQYGTFEFEPDPEPLDERLVALRKLKVPALLAYAAEIGVDAAVLDQISKPKTSKQTIIDAIAAAGDANPESEPEEEA